MTRQTTPTVQSTERTRMHFLEQKVILLEVMQDLENKSRMIASDVPISNLNQRANYDWFIPDKHPVAYPFGSLIECSDTNKVYNYLSKYRKDLFKDSRQVNKFNPEGLPIYVAPSSMRLVI